MATTGKQGIKDLFDKLTNDEKKEAESLFVSSAGNPYGYNSDHPAFKRVGATPPNIPHGWDEFINKDEEEVYKFMAAFLEMKGRSNYDWRFDLDGGRRMRKRKGKSVKKRGKRVTKKHKRSKKNNKNKKKRSTRKMRKRRSMRR